MTEMQWFVCIRTRIFDEDTSLLRFKLPCMPCANRCYRAFRSCFWADEEVHVRTCCDNFCKEWMLLLFDALCELFCENSWRFLVLLCKMEARNGEITELCVWRYLYYSVWNACVRQKLHDLFSKIHRVHRFAGLYMVIVRFLKK